MVWWLFGKEATARPARLEHMMFNGRQIERASHSGQMNTATGIVNAIFGVSPCSRGRSACRGGDGSRATGRKPTGSSLNTDGYIAIPFVSDDSGRGTERSESSLPVERFSGGAATEWSEAA